MPFNIYKSQMIIHYSTKIISILSRHYIVCVYFSFDSKYTVFIEKVVFCYHILSYTHTMFQFSISCPVVVRKSSNSIKRYFLNPFAILRNSNFSNTYQMLQWSLITDSSPFSLYSVIFLSFFLLLDIMLVIKNLFSTHSFPIIW